MAFDPKRLPDKLVEAYRAKRCAALVGAGASIAAGLPDWSGLLDEMIKEAERHKVVTPEKVADYRKLLGTPGKYLMIATGLEEDLGSYFGPFMTRVFIDSKPKPTSLHRTLAHMDQLQFMVTTNYDTLLEKCYRKEVDDDVPVPTYQEAGEVQSRMSRRDYFILKAHGDAQRASSGIILTDLDYRRILYRERAYQSVLASIFTMFTMVFVGTSMTDPEVNLLLHYIADAFTPGSGPVHYALMADEDTTAVERDRWFRDLNVQIVPISKAGNYAELEQALRTLHEVAKA